MAAVIDVNVLCKKPLDAAILQNLITKIGAFIKSIKCIDSWGWDNEQCIGSLNRVDNIIEKNKIIVIQLGTLQLRDIGIYIEKVDNAYLYTLWINTEGSPALDCDKITKQNRYFYEKVYQEIEDLRRRNEILFDIIGIGVETDFYCSKDIKMVVRNSKNIAAWIINADVNIEITEKCYTKKPLYQSDYIIFEKT